MTEQDKAMDSLRQLYRAKLSEGFAKVIRDTMRESQWPEVVLFAAPMSLANCAGTYVQLFTHTGHLNDGEVDVTLKLAVDEMRKAADPVQNPLADTDQLGKIHHDRFLRAMKGGDQ